ncbi:MAG TPA: DUF5336 domain-containing protein [Mycobacterium sp.]
MTYPYGSANQYPTAAYGAYWPQITTATSQRTSRASYLIWMVVLLGLATYFVSYAALPQRGDIGWGVRFSAVAAIVAALGLLPRQSVHTKVVVTLTVMGFLEAPSQLFKDGQNAGWAAIAIVVLTALQAMTAIAALISQLSSTAADNRGLVGSDAYAYYSQAAQQYYAANNQQRQQQPAQSHATAQGTAAATAQAQDSAAQRHALYAEYLSAQQTGPNRAAASPQSNGRIQTVRPASGTGMPRIGAAESIRPDSDPATGSAAEPPAS